MRYLHAIYATIAMALFVSPAQAELVVNGGFETSDLTGWTESQPGTFVVNDDLPHTGIYSLLVTNGDGNVSDEDEFVQNISTVNGTSYRISFWIHNFGVGGDGIIVLWDEDIVLESIPLASPLEDWQLFEIDVVADADVQALRFICDDGTAAYYVDDISVTAIPEANVLVILGLSTATSLGLYWRKRWYSRRVSS